MSRSMRALILQIAMLLLAAPLLANADPSPLGDAEERREDRRTDDANVDCSNLDDDDAREKCREQKGDGRTDDANVDCSKINDNEARRRCRAMQIRN